MTEIESEIRLFEKLKTEINNASTANYPLNRELFNELKDRLIENGFDNEVITIDHNEKFFTPSKDFERVLGNPNDLFKNHQGNLASKCTKAIRELKKRATIQDAPEKKQSIKTVVKKEMVYPPTYWRYFRNASFLTIILTIISLCSTAFYFIGQNSKDKENAEIIIQLGENNAEITELKKLVLKNSIESKDKEAEIEKLETVLLKLRNKNTKSTIKVNK